MAAPYSRSRTAAGKTAAMSTSTSFRWRAITARSVIGDKSSGAFSVSSRIVRANVPSSDVSSPKARAQKASNGARLSRSEEHTSELQSQSNLVCRLLLEKKKKTIQAHNHHHTTHNPTQPLR